MFDYQWQQTWKRDIQWIITRQCTEKKKKKLFSVVKKVPRKRKYMLLGLVPKMKISKALRSK